MLSPLKSFQKSSHLLVSPSEAHPKQNNTAQNSTERHFMARNSVGAVVLVEPLWPYSVSGASTQSGFSPARPVTPPVVEAARESLVIGTA